MSAWTHRPCEGSFARMAPNVAGQLAHTQATKTRAEGVKDTHVHTQPLSQEKAQRQNRHLSALERYRVMQKVARKTHAHARGPTNTQKDTYTQTKCMEVKPLQGGNICATATSHPSALIASLRQHTHTHNHCDSTHKHLHPVTVWGWTDPLLTHTHTHSEKARERGRAQ